MHIENIVIGNPIVDPASIFGKDEDDWNTAEKEKTKNASRMRFLF